ncbi:MAG: redox-sensing transcriptional repressor Rex [Chitinivibrionales bacterium]
MKTGKKAVLRLSRYKNALYGFKTYGVEKFLSWDLASALGLTAAQVRKDFSTFGLQGKKKVGYSVDNLIERIGEILGKNEIRTAVLCGAGPLGKAILEEGLLTDAPVRLVAVFNNPEEKNTVRIKGITVHPLVDLTRIVQEHDVTIGIIAATGAKAQRFLDHLVLAGVQGILGLSRNELKAPRSCIVTTVNLARELENVIYFVNNNQKRTTK